MEPAKQNPIDSPAQPVSVADLVDPLGERMPPLTEGQTNAPLPTETPAPTPSGAVDARGVRFDPAKHASENGKPKTTKDGFYYSNKLGKHGKSKPTTAPATEQLNPVSGGIESERGAPSFASVDRPSAEKEKQIPSDEFDLMAEMVLQSAYGPVMILFSEQARPNAEEHGALKQSYAAWFRHKQIKEFSPGWGAAICTIAIAVKKTEKPEVRERAQTLFEAIKAKFVKPKKIPA